jgi:serine/threonine-protein kinase
MSKRQSESFEQQASFLTYSEADVEHDFLRIIELVRRKVEVPSSRRFFGLLPRRKKQTWTGKLIVIIDELDKLTATDDGVACLETLLSTLKNVLTASGAHFIFVGGPDLHDLFLRDLRDNVGMYGGVFSFHLYVPCNWGAARQIMESAALGPIADEPLAEDVSDHLEFKGHGTPRLLLSELNSLVSWDSDSPFIRLSKGEKERVSFYAGVQRSVSRFLSESAETGVLSLPVDLDRWQLGAYVAADWALRSDGATFAPSEVISAAPALAADQLAADRDRIELLFDHLVSQGMLERVREGNAPDLTVIGSVAGSRESSYRLAREVKSKLRRFSRWRDDVAPVALRALPDVEGLDAFEIEDEIGHGGMGRVFRAFDKVVGREVAIKVLAGSLLADEKMRKRFRREADLAASFDHPNLVKTYAVLEGESGGLAIVMQLLRGQTLGETLAERAVTPAESVLITSRLLNAVQYVADRDLVRLDLKPSNIVLEAGLNPIIVDFGLIKPRAQARRHGRDPITQVGIFVGTPRYVSPEQMDGAEIDIRADIYSVGLILFEMISGHSKKKEGDSTRGHHQSRQELDLSGLEVSASLKDVLAQACAFKLSKRFPSPRAMSEALLLTPEGGEALEIEKLDAPSSPSSGTAWRRIDETDPGS